MTESASHGSGWRRALVASLTLLVIFGVAASARANKVVTITIPDRHGEIPAKWLPYSGEPRADVLLPDGYSPRKRYPLILNLSGLGGDYAAGAWGTSYHVAAILVTPEAYDGWYVDWWNNGARGNPAWESYYLDDVLPYILSHYAILPQRRYHAVVGISMGGLGATYLGGRLPGFFGSVASLSGFVDPQYFGALTVPAMGEISSAQTGVSEPYDAVYGPWDSFYATGHNPTELVANLAQSRIFETTGTGDPSSAELGDPTGAGAGPALEGGIIYPMNQAFHQAAVAAHLDVTYQVHPGGHDSPNFSAEIAAMFAWNPFKAVPTAPSAWTNQTVATDGQLWDVGYRFTHPPTRVVQFRRTGSSLSIGAAGSPVTITSTGGCTFHLATPATVRIPPKGCHAPAKRPRPKRTHKPAAKRHSSSRRAG